jgi:hypothetical protein
MRARGVAAVAAFAVVAALGGVRAARAQPAGPDEEGEPAGAVDEPTYASKPGPSARFVPTDAVLGYPPEPEAPTIDLYTFGNGELIFEKFGHAALCLTYHARGRQPMCFNYGVTNFREVGKLAWGFLRTEQKFWVEPEPLGNLLGFYARFEDRTIYRQRLFSASDARPPRTGLEPLDEAAAKKLEARLRHDILPENKFYYYDHFFDNCTTRLRDMVNDVTDGKLKAGATDVYYPITFREIGQNGLNAWGTYLGFTDFFGGRTLDRYPTMWEAQFHPDVFRSEVAAKLGVQPVVVYERKGPPFPETGPKGRPLTLFLAFLFGLPLLLARWRRRFERAALAWACVPLILWGLVTWSLSIISSIPMFRWNEAVFLFVPFDVAVPFLGERRRRIYARVRLGMVLLVSLLVSVGIFKQPLWVPILTAFLPFAILSFDLPWRGKAAVVAGGEAVAEDAAALKRESGKPHPKRARGERGGRKKR